MLLAGGCQSCPSDRPNSLSGGLIVKVVTRLGIGRRF
jgi:hypothetical protein